MQDTMLFKPLLIKAPIILCRTMKSTALGRTGPLTAEMKAKFATMPSSKSDIEDAISQKDEEIENIQLSNPRAKEEFDNRRARIEKTRRALQDQLENIQVEKAGIEKDKVMAQFCLGAMHEPDTFTGWQCLDSHSQRKACYASTAL